MSERPSFTVEYLDPPVMIDAEPLPEEFSASRLKRSVAIVAGVVLVLAAAIVLVWSLSLAIRYTFRPRETDADHIKRRILDEIDEREEAPQR